MTPKTTGSEDTGKVTASPIENPNNNATLFDAHEMIVYLPKFYKELRGLRNSDATETREILNLFVAGLLCTFSLFSGGDIWKLRRMAGLSETLWNQINLVSMQFSPNSTQTIFERLEAARVATTISDEWCRALNRQIDPSSLISNKPSNGYIKFWTTTLERFRSFAEYHKHPIRDNIEFANLGEVQRTAEAKIKLSQDHSLGLSLFPEEYALGRPTDGIYASKTPLMVASLNGHSKIVGLLLRRGEWINATDGEGKTSLIMASNNGHSKVVELLLRSKAEVGNTDHEGSTALIKAVSNGHSEVVELLLRSKADTNAISYNGDTALSISASKGYRDITILLLENGEEPSLSLIDGSTPLTIAIEEGHRHIALPLLDTNADPNVVTCKGTALGTAFKSHDSTSVRLLLRRGADPTLGILSNPPSHRNQAQKLIEQALFGGNHWQKDAARKLRIHFINTFSKLSSSMKRGLGTERSTSHLRRRQWWSRGIRSIRRVWSGMVPTTILEILRILLVVGGIASTLDDLSQEGIHLEQPRLKREDDSLIEDPHLNFLRNGYLETFKYDIGRWSHAIQCYRDRIMLEGWAVELWGSPTQLFPNSAKDLFGLSLDDDEAFIPNDQEPPVVQELYLGNSPTFGVDDRMQPADSEAATSLEIMFFEDPPDIPSDLQYSIMLATYLLAGATFTILLLFLRALAINGAGI
ncbi:hypothetical protein ANO14919_075160 [Xylariales sp. No.14919]|nr:hypothetical protein ANO14919_075160 [Xylariales sp. No.14919]